MTRSDLALAALATAAVPGLQPTSVVGMQPRHARSRYRTAFVEDMTGRRWVVRAPRNVAAGAELERNDGLIHLLGRHLPFKVPAAAGYADSANGRAAIYPYVEGKSLDFHRLPPGPGLAAAVGRALAAIHNIPPELFEEGGTPVFDAAHWRDRLFAELDRAAETGHVPNGLLARWEHALESAAVWNFATTPTHGWFDGSDLLVAFDGDDAATGRVVAVTGWERAQVGDPAEDFAALIDQAPGASVESVMDSYRLARAQRPDPHLMVRARLASEMRLISGLATAVSRDDTDEVQHRADQLRKLDRLTSVDDPLVPTASAAPTVAAASAASGQPWQERSEDDADGAAEQLSLDDEPELDNPELDDPELREPELDHEPGLDDEPEFEDDPDSEDVDITTAIPIAPPQPSPHTAEFEDARDQDSSAEVLDSVDPEEPVEPTEPAGTVDSTGPIEIPETGEPANAAHPAAPGHADESGHAQEAMHVEPEGYAESEADGDTDEGDTDEDADGDADGDADAQAPVDEEDQSLTDDVPPVGLAPDERPDSDEGPDIWR